MRTSILTALALLPLAACSGDGHDHAHDGDHAHGQAALDPAVPSADATRHAVACGCDEAVTQTDYCSEWIQVEGEWVALELPMDLGPMPFCRKDGLIAAVDGGLEGEGEARKFVATAFALVED